MQVGGGMAVASTGSVARIQPRLLHGETDPDSMAQPTTNAEAVHAWMLMPGPSSRRATATLQSSSASGGSGAPAMAVPALARKFCTITSCEQSHGRKRRQHSSQG